MSYGSDGPGTVTGAVARLHSAFVPLRPLIARLVGFIVPAVPFVVGADAFTPADATAPSEPLEPHASTGGVHAQAVTTICSPIVGAGKAVGVPIRVKDADGQVLNDVSGLTFVLDDGTNTQDVTAQVTTTEQQPLITSDTYVPKINNNYANLNATFGGAGPAFSVSNPGYFFLNCTPDPADSTRTFGAGVVLKALSGGTVISSAPVEGRSATKHMLYGYANENAASVAITPAGTDLHKDFPGMYAGVIQKAQLRFRTFFAEAAVIEMGNATVDDTPCYNDLVQASGSTWGWTTSGLSFISELTASGATSWPILAARTTGTAGPVVSGIPACDMTNSTFEDDLFLNMLAAQALLFEGPMGLVPTAISDAAPALKPAVLLEPVVPPTTTTIATSTTTPDTTTTIVDSEELGTTQDDEPLPGSGSNSRGDALLATSMALAGALLVAQSRRRVRAGG